MSLKTGITSFLLPLQPQEYHGYSCVNHSRSLLRHLQIPTWLFQNNTPSTGGMARYFTKTSAPGSGQGRAFQQNLLVVAELRGCRVTVPKLASREDCCQQMRPFATGVKEAGRESVRCSTGSKSHHPTSVLHLSRWSPVLWPRQLGTFRGGKRWGMTVVDEQDAYPAAVFGRRVSGSRVGPCAFAAVSPAGLHTGSHPQDGGVSTVSSTAGIPSPALARPMLESAPEPARKKTRGRLIIIVSENRRRSEKSSESFRQQKGHEIPGLLMELAHIPQKLPEEPPLDLQTRDMSPTHFSPGKKLVHHWKHKHLKDQRLKPPSLHIHLRGADTLTLDLGPGLPKFIWTRSHCTGSWSFQWYEGGITSLPENSPTSSEKLLLWTLLVITHINELL